MSTPLTSICSPALEPHVLLLPQHPQAQTQAVTLHTKKSENRKSRALQKAVTAALGGRSACCWHAGHSCRGTQTSPWACH